MGREPTVRALRALIGFDGPDHAHLPPPRPARGSISTREGSLSFSEL